jgi:crotonobetainyl-CoA:carnitine CoA-transferase CaiB-like acyl-CoA transferase
MFEWMGRPEEFADPKFDNLMERFGATDLVPKIARFFADKTRLELEEQGQLHGVPIAGVLSIEEALESPQIRARGFFREVELAPGLVAPVPAGIMEVDGIRASTLTVERAPVASRAPAASILAGRLRANQGRPLEGVRVLDLGVIIVGGDTGRLLGDLGADVIKIENSAFIDGARASLLTGSGMAPGFASGHRNKRSVGIDLRSPEGLEIVRRLVAESDIVLTNFKPGVIANLGLDFEALKSANPGIVVVDSSAFGPTGPWAKRLGYGPLVRAATGFTEQWVYPDEPGSFSDAVTVYPDHVCSRIGALGALALLIRRERTRRGGSVSISQAEVMMSGMAPKLAADALVARGHVASGPDRDTPWGLFPSAGDDEWIVITVDGDDEWQALARTMARHDLAGDPALADRAGRAAARERILAAVAEWTSSRSPMTAMQLLQAAHVPAGAMLRAIDIPDWDFYRMRRDFREELHPLADAPYVMENVQIHAEHIADPPLRQAPLLGEQTAEVLQEVLGFDSETVDALVSRGVLEATVVPVGV